MVDVYVNVAHHLITLVNDYCRRFIDKKLQKKVQQRQ